MIETNTQAFDEIAICAVAQGFFEPIDIDGEMNITLGDYLKIRNLEW